MVTLSDLADQLGLAFQGDGRMRLNHACGFSELNPGGLAYLADSKSLNVPEGVFSSKALDLEGLKGKGGAVIVPQGTLALGLNLIFAPDPLLAHVAATLILHPGMKPNKRIHPQALAQPKAKIAKGAGIDFGAMVYAGATVGKGTRVMAGAVIMEGAQVGEDCIIYPNAVIGPDSEIGDRCIIHAGVSIGTDGFGFFQRDGENHKIPQVGKVVIEDEVEIGANSCIDRARFSVTRIGRNTKIDNLVHIAHNVEVGPYSLITAQSGIAGSTKTGSHLMMGGQSGIRDNLVLGQGVSLLARTLVTGKAQDGEVLAGMPGRPMKEWRKLQAALAGLDKIVERLQKIETFIMGLGFKRKPTNNP
ncbi:MAG: hypothetical protein A2508_06835 [Candidatus Lambdaproteobacteria bacterium RIFOXYD12_FULL_49_8]|nr:MAG: hypothetical protein A2508_06835 [Candidatus Lambdaproteobacteria bacterium RIFOXYD12_FULL_49_8]